MYEQGEGCRSPKKLEEFSLTPVYGLIIDQTIYILSLFLVLKLSFGRFEERKKN